MLGRRDQGRRPAKIITISAAHGKNPEHLRKPQLGPCTSSRLIINTITVEVTMQVITVAVTTVEAMMEEAVDVDDMLTVQQSVVSWLLANVSKFSR